MRHIILIVYALLLLTAPTMSAHAKSSLLHFERDRVLNVCKRACHSPGGNPRVCCICNGGDWINGRCA
jgi:hypothetical protein